jgi:hypothetical protein
MQPPQHAFGASARSSVEPHSASVAHALSRGGSAMGAAEAVLDAVGVVGSPGPAGAFSVEAP